MKIKLEMTAKVNREFADIPKLVELLQPIFQNIQHLKITEVE
jgi:hypothetical protein